MKLLLKHTIRLLVVLLLPATIISCGGGGGVDESSYTQPTHADLTISLSLNSPPLIPVGVKMREIDITVHLPDGVTFTGISPEVVGVNNSGGQQNGQIAGVVRDDINRTVSFLVQDATLPNGIEVGPVAKIRCSLNTTLGAIAFTTANGGNPLTAFVAVGETGPPLTSHDLTIQLTPNMSVFLY